MTKNRKPFKTNNMKTTVKKLAAGTIFALILLAGNVRANGTEMKASSLDIVETSLQLENWMTNETIWNNNSTYTLDFGLETEADLELENWMTSDSNWEYAMVIEIEPEAELEIEDWMTSEEVWNVNEIEIEEKLALENWMTDSKVWK